MAGSALSAYADFAKFSSTAIMPLNLFGKPQLTPCAYCDAQRPADDSKCKNCGAANVAPKPLGVGIAGATVFPSADIG